ncbi:MAG TPA: dihydrolipoamide acetyltransferase family protein [Candidatus Acidoferrales bacterium]|nr:dihydrolipoamide acetyltransferase family protein [Candidatus Acidoferrales bacterium]
MSKTTRVTMPQLGESVHEGTISRWLVKPGEKVTEFEPLLEVDTDKVNAEVPSPVTGVLKEIIAKEGETVSAGAEIAVVEVEADGGAPAPVEPKPEAAKPVAEKKAPARPAARREPEPEPAAEPKPAPAGPEPKLEGGEHRYSPAVLMLAAEKRVDLDGIQGSGIAGRVTKKDVQKAIDAGTAAPPPAAPAAAPAAITAPLAARPSEGDQVVPLTRVRKLIAENMTRSKTTIPHAWQTQEADMSGVVASRGAHKARFQEQEGFSLTYLPYVIKAAASALREHPQVNATFNETEIVVHRQVNIGVSVGLEDTLVVPVVRSADGLSIAGIGRAVYDLAERARTKKLKADDLAGATFTVNNSGTFGTLFSYSVINPGQAGILTMEAIVERPVAVQGMIGIKPMMYLCFSFDHRVLDGLQAARFLTSCRKWLESVTAETPIY